MYENWNRAHTTLLYVVSANCNVISNINLDCQFKLLVSASFLCMHDRNLNSRYPKLAIEFEIEARQNLLYKNSITFISYKRQTSDILAGVRPCKSGGPIFYTQHYINLLLLVYQLITSTYYYTICSINKIKKLFNA